MDIFIFDPHIHDSKRYSYLICVTKCFKIHRWNGSLQMVFWTNVNPEVDTSGCHQHWRDIGNFNLILSLVMFFYSNIKYLFLGGAKKKN